jgi:hypothetical protein
MNRLQTELNRLYRPPVPQSEYQDPAGEELCLINTDGQVRAMVVDLARQAGWDGIAALWQGIQEDLELPAPAIAVSGIEGFQVWFSLSEPVPLAQALNFLESLRLRYLGAIAPKHIVMKPAADDLASRHAQHARMVPSLQAETGRWSAFVTPGLAGMFADEPWLDLPPSPDAQASLLSRIESIKPADFQQALRRLGPSAASAARDAGSASAGRTVSAAPTRSAEQDLSNDGLDPKRFLFGVMNDPATELHLRIEAAKALLPYFE